MSVRQSLLAILDQGPCYGYQLRSEFDRRTGSAWPLNVGQIYNTLDRLERDGLVVRGEADDQGHIYWHITPAGRDEVRSWLGAPVERGQGSRDELAVKLALAATLPGVDAGEVVAVQREASLARLDRLRAQRPETTAPSALAAALVTDALILSAEAELRWLDHVDATLTAHPAHALALDLSAERPRRGRPSAGRSIA